MQAVPFLSILFKQLGALQSLGKVPGTGDHLLVEPQWFSPVPGTRCPAARENSPKNGNTP